MNQTIRPTKVLDYYDGVLVFTGEDADGHQYLGSIIDTTEGIDRYLVKGTTPERIKDLENGRVDLRSLLLENPSDSWYLTFDGHAPDQPLELHPQDGPLEATDFLPSDSYFLGDEDSGLPPRLIEKWLPINEVSTEAIRERAAASALPPVNWMHVWWARRPLAPSRASVLLSLLPESADAPQTRRNAFDLLGTSPDIHRITQRLAAASESGERDQEGYGKHRRAFTHNPTAQQLAWLNDNLLTHDPVVLDVTAGGGSIPFEAGRLGLRTIANELNPVACFILRATCQWPQQYGYALLYDYREVSATFKARVNDLLAGVYPDDYAPDCAGGNCPHPQRHRCTNDCDDSPKCSHRKVGNPEHINVRAQRYAQTYLWARTARCPGCGVAIPLSPNWRLDNKGTGMRVEPDATGIKLRIVHDREACSDCQAEVKDCHLANLYPDQKASDGTVARAIATCPACGSTTPKDYLAHEAQAGRMGHRLYCVIYRDSWRDKTKNGKERKRETTCRVFAEPEEHHFASDAQVAGELAQLQHQWDTDDILPNEVIPEGDKTSGYPLRYGMPIWKEMFSPRQQLAHGYCVQAFRECVDADAEAGRMDTRHKAAWGYVAAALDKLISTNSLLCRWHPNRQVVAGTFDSHDFGMKWSYSEMAVTCRGLGLEWSLNDIADCISEMLAMTGHRENADQLVPDTDTGKIAPPAEVITGDARDLPLGDASVDCIVFDPPYEENVCYAELSDFFYVWLKRTAGYVFPDDFTDYLTEKDQEAIASPARFRNRAVKGQSAKTLALADYQEKMAEIFTECRRVIKPDGITTVMFNHKSTAAWDAITVALINARFAITRTWPVKTEAESSIHIKGRAAARTTILLVCRPRDENPFPKPWHEVEELIAQAVRDDIRDNLSQADLKPIDLCLSAFGPALRVISEHWGTERESANPDRPERPFAVTPTDALQVARREVSQHRAQAISRDWANNPVDAGTKFYVLAKDSTENDTLLFDEANLLARAIGVRLEKNDAAMKSIVSFKSDKVLLLSARDRLAARNIGEDINPGTTLDTVHTAIALTERRNTQDAQQWLTQRLHDPQESQFRATLQALIRTTNPGHDDYQAQRNLWQALYGEEPPQPAVMQPALL